MRVAVLLLALCAGAVHAQTTPEALAMLRKIHQATQKLSYTGTFVWQQGGRSEISRITRLADRAGDIEKLEALDGEPREIVRTRDIVRCFLPESRTVKIERRGDRRGFPALLPDHFIELARHYVITKGEKARIAGFDCESVELAPRDELRYGYRFWADAATGMLLRAQTVNDKGETVEQFSFTQLTIGGVTRDKVRPRHSARDWRVEDATAAPANLAASGWTVGADLPGYRKVGEVRRKLRDAPAVGQVVYSDGLAAVSVFIEPLAGRAEPVLTGLSSLGAVNIFTRQVANHLVTVVGEAPAASVQRIGRTVEYRRPQ